MIWQLAVLVFYIGITDQNVCGSENEVSFVCYLPESP